MKIELSKEIKLDSFEFVGEVEFLERKSPYIELLQNINTEDELINTLEEKKIPKPAIENIIQRLEEAKLLKNGDIVNLEEGFSNKEYGKYSLEIYKNDSELPFKYKNKDIKREKAIFKNRIDDIKQDNKLINIVKDKTNKDFEIIKIENGNFLPKTKTKNNPKLKLIFKDKKWNIELENNTFPMEKIALEKIFNDDWDEKYSSLMIDFPSIEEKEEIIDIMEYSYNKKLDLDDYGILNAKFESIPIIPKTVKDAKKWFLQLLKKEIENKNSYISKDELKQIWFNLLDKKEKFKKFDLQFDIDVILKEFGKRSKYYWLLQTGIDLYPFDNESSYLDRIFIQNLDDFKKFDMNIEELIIIDRYVNTLRHFEILERVLEKLNHPKVTLYTTKVYDNNQQKINKIIEKSKIIRKIKEKNEIPHSRYWIFNKKSFYKCAESLDGIDSTSFDLYKKSDVQRMDKKALELFQENINE